MLSESDNIKAANNVHKFKAQLIQAQFISRGVYLTISTLSTCPLTS